MSASTPRIGTEGFSERELERYERQLILSNWSLDKQQLLQTSKIAVSAKLPSALLYLAGAGVGTILVTNAEDTDEALIAHAVAINPDICLRRWNNSSAEGQLTSWISIENEVPLPDFALPTAKISYSPAEKNISLVEDVSERKFQLAPQGSEITHWNLLAGSLSAIIFLKWRGGLFS